jgi:predicted kinase
MSKLILLRGLPGAGKSTLAKTFEGARHFEADMFFLDENGNYNFDATKLREAHEWCRNNVDNTMSFGIDVVVSNTFTQKWEMDAYYELAKKHNYVVFSLIVENRHGGVNKHNVPEDKLLAMKERFEYSL